MNKHLERELFSQVKTPVKTSDVATIKALFQSRDWKMRCPRLGPMLTESRYDRGYYYLPDWLDNTIIPEEGLQRLNAVKELGIEIQGIIIGHEVRKTEIGNIVEIDWVALDQKARETTTRAKEKAIETAKTYAKVIGGLLVACTFLTGVILKFALMAAPALLVDPLLLIVLNDEANTNVEIYWWRD